MSLIRCLNNPEGLYVWQDEQNTHFMYGRDGEDLIIPTLYFDRIMNKCYEKWEGYPGRKITSGNVISLEEVGPYGKVCLRYDGSSINMWGVTFFYIYSHWLKHYAQTN